jgi:hypothetical protein
MAVEVYVWWPHAGVGIGHSALLAGGEYLSFWPGGAGIGSEKDTAKFFPALFMTRLADDERSEGRRPDQTTGLSRMNETAMKDFIRRFKAAASPYHLKFNNCSQPVKIALYEGSGHVAPNFRVIAPASVYGAVPPSMARAESWIRSTWNPDSVAKYAEMLKRMGK